MFNMTLFVCSFWAPSHPSLLDGGQFWFRKYKIGTLHLCGWCYQEHVHFAWGKGYDHGDAHVKSNEVV